MHSIRFLWDSEGLGAPLDGLYDPSLVVLSVVIAILAAYAALGLAAQISSSEDARKRALWHYAGAVAMGVGVWAMHFIGMLAFRLPVPVIYEPSITVLSVTPAILASFVALRFISQPDTNLRRVALCGTLMGLGICTMHYMGMAAMRLPAEMYYRPVLFGLSVVVAAVAASVALSISRRASDTKRPSVRSFEKIAAASVMGFAVAGMHYTGMAAARFYVADGTPEPVGAIDPVVLGVLVALASILILSFATFVTIVDRRLQAAARSERVSRSRMLQAIESISEGFALYDVDDRLVLSNRKYRELLGFNGEDGLQGQQFESLIRGAAEHGLIPEAKDCVEEWVASRVARHRQPPGPYIQERSGGVWMQINEYKTTDGETVGIYADISELKRAEQKLADALDNLQATQAHLVQSEKMAALGKLTAGIAHEINNPVGIVTSSADNSVRCVQKIMQALTDSQSLEEVRSDRTFQRSVSLIRENADVIVQASGRIAKIVQSLKSFHPENQTFQHADLEAGMESALSLLEHLRRSEISVVKQFGAVGEVYCNPGEITQVFITLIANALQAIDGSGEVRIETSKDADAAHVVIADTGKGMSSEQVATLFDIGFKTKGNRIGVGMGLVNAHTIITRHGGTIDASSELGVGTSVHIRLPIASPSRAGTASVDA